MPRKVTKGPTRVAGQGADGDLFGVTSITSEGGDRHIARKQPCPTCPWRLDQPVGRFPAQAYRESAPTSYDAAWTTFGCHESGTDKPATCAGFLLRNADNNLIVRIAQATGKLDLTDLRDDGNALYPGYREMAIANGVDPDDPVLKQCRGNGEEHPSMRQDCRKS
jgi:hypothetical protein